MGMLTKSGCCNVSTPPIPPMLVNLASVVSMHIEKRTWPGILGLVVLVFVDDEHIMELFTVTTFTPAVWGNFTVNA